MLTYLFGKVAMDVFYTVEEHDLIFYYWQQWYIPSGRAKG